MTESSHSFAFSDDHILGYCQVCWVVVAFGGVSKFTVDFFPPVGCLCLLFVDDFLFLPSDNFFRSLNIPAFWHSSMNSPRAG